ncbi:MAG: polymerase sigma-70 factor [Mucilaginibacter sp.]|nr:polymerase sigma-70 factor [Mucilaginibacter sp.]
MFNHAPTDSELWEAIKLNDTQAFELLFERYWQLIYTTAFSYLKDDEACSEITNDIFLNIWQKRGTLDIIVFKSYLTSASRYHVYKYLKSRKSSKLNYVEDYDKLSSINAVENNGEEKIRYLEFEYDIESLLYKLPQRCRQIFIMSRMKNLTNSEIADKLSISKRTVENQITIALKHLRLYLKHIASVIILFHLIK